MEIKLTDPIVIRDESVLVGREIKTIAGDVAWVENSAKHYEITLSLCDGACERVIRLKASNITLPKELAHDGS